MPRARNTLLASPSCQHGQPPAACLRHGLSCTSDRFHCLSTASKHAKCGCSVFLTQSATDYGPYVQNLASPLHTTTLVEACTQLLVDQWVFMRANVRRLEHAVILAFQL